MKLKCIQRVYGHLAVLLNPFSFVERNSAVKKPEMEDVCTARARALPFKYIRPRVLFARAVHIYRRTLPTLWIVRQRWFCSRSRRRSRKRRRVAGICSEGSLIFFSWRFSVFLSVMQRVYCQREDEETGRISRPSKRTAERASSSSGV